VAALGWVALHLLFFTEQVEFNLYMALIFAVAGVGVFAGTMMVLSQASERLPVMKLACLAAGIGAGAMFYYDQINMALVTGPVAMLWWMLLGIGDSFGRADVRGPLKRAGGWGIGVLGMGAAAILLGMVWKPMVSGTMPWDPAPWEDKYLVSYAGGDTQGARAALEAALQRAPDSIELRLQYITLLHDVFHEPVAAEIRKVLMLDRANARIRVQLGLMESDLPASERAVILRQALEFDRQLPEDEVKRLPAETISTIRAAIVALQERSGVRLP
jgi:hypothetical protein